MGHKTRPFLAPLLAVLTLASLLIGISFAETNPLSDRPAIVMHAEDAQAAPEAAPVQVEQLQFADLADEQITAIAKLPDEVQPLAKAIASDNPGAKFNYHDGTLTVDLSRLIGTINPLSDCPNNTQFGVNFSDAGHEQKQREQTIERITVAWTRLRHRAPDALVLKINITDRQSDDGKAGGGGWKNYDVQLDLSPRLSRAE